jgi:hypothetical protein
MRDAGPRIVRWADLRPVLCYWHDMSSDGPSVTFVGGPLILPPPAELDASDYVTGIAVPVDGGSSEAAYQVGLLASSS